MTHTYTVDCRNSTMLNDYVFECDGINDCEDGNDELDCCKFGNYVSA